LAARNLRVFDLDAHVMDRLACKHVTMACSKEKAFCESLDLHAHADEAFDLQIRDNGWQGEFVLAQRRRFMSL